MYDVFEVPWGQTKVRVRHTDNKNDTVEGEIAFYAHFWCVQVCEALSLQYSLQGLRGRGQGLLQVLSPGVVLLQTVVLKSLLLIISHLAQTIFFLLFPTFCTCVFCFLSRSL